MVLTLPQVIFCLVCVGFIIGAYFLGKAVGRSEEYARQARLRQIVRQINAKYPSN